MTESRPAPTQFDEQLVCTTSPDKSVCESRQDIVNVFTSLSGIEETDGFSELGITTEMDDVKKRLKLAEMTAGARLINCGGMVEGECPVRMKMSKSDTRTTVIGGLRKVFGRKSN